MAGANNRSLKAAGIPKATIQTLRVEHGSGLSLRSALGIAHERGLPVGAAHEFMAKRDAKAAASKEGQATAADFRAKAAERMKAAATERAAATPVERRAALQNAMASRGAQASALARSMGVAGKSAMAARVLNGRIARVAGGAAVSDARRASLALAHEAGVDDRTFAKLATAKRLSRKADIELPAHRLESMSRGRGWARNGTGKNVRWGERSKNGYKVGPGEWSVGGHDGFHRKGEETWNVRHVMVGGKTWTIAS